MQDFYETTLDALKDAKNERLWFKTMTKLGKLYFDREDYGKLSRILKQLHTSCTTQEGNKTIYFRIGTIVVNFQFRTDLTLVVINNNPHNFR